MPLYRRELLMGLTVLSAGLPLTGALKAGSAQKPAVPDSRIRLVRICEAYASPAIASGDYLLVDIQGQHFRGDGLYLYPHWGQPRPYRVERLANGRLGFYHPGSGSLQWSLRTAAQTRLFAASVVNRLPAQDSGRIALALAQIKLL
ncbi:MAG: hypothetical protein RQ899_10150 [Pseudomonadales bacterium]|nr:hypothetical protein [Pseudomonadales bacterium]